MSLANSTPSPLPEGHLYQHVGSYLTSLGRTVVGSLRRAVVGAGVKRMRMTVPSRFSHRDLGRHPRKGLWHNVAI